MCMKITLRSPSDFHTHLRGYNGDVSDPKAARPEAILETVSSLQFPFAQVLAMPNLLPTHIVNATQVDAYREKLVRYLPP